MSDPDRGYSYGDAPLAFDARRPVRGGSPMPTTLIISGVILAVLVGAVLFVYRGGFRPDNGAPRPVGTAVNDIKAAPPANAQPADPAAGLQIYHAENGAPPPAGTAAPAAQPVFAAPPEQPQARPEPRPVAQPTQAVASAGLKPAQPATAKPVAASLAAAAPPVAKASIAKAPVLAATAVATPAAKPLVKQTGAAGAAVVQIGAFSSFALADKGWSDAARVAPGDSLGKGKRVEPVEKDGKTLYRTSVTGFASHAEAAAFCATLKAAGKSCLVK